MKSIDKMKSNPIIIICVFFILGYNVTTFGQQSLEIQTEIENTSSKKADDGSILVKCNFFSSNYLFLLYDEVPLANKEAIQKSERITEAQYKFYNLKAGIYFVCVYDQDSKSSCYKIKIDHN
jgi:hypothetical protein